MSGTVDDTVMRISRQVPTTDLPSGGSSYSWEGILTQMYGPRGSTSRAEFDKTLARIKKRDERLDRMFGWMKRVPPRFPPDIDEDGWNHNYWKGLGPLMFLFWHTLADEKSFYGVLDMLSFHYFQDAYVMSFKDIRMLRAKYHKLRTSQNEP